MTLGRSTIALWIGAAGCAPPPVQITDITASVDPEVSTLVRVQWTQDADADATWLEFELGADTTRL